jgi:hypothetical protein
MAHRTELGYSGEYLIQRFCRRLCVQNRRRSASLGSLERVLFTSCHEGIIDLSQHTTPSFSRLSRAAGGADALP